MKYWIGIVGSQKTLERFNEATDTWFCMPKSCEPGDKIAMYATKKVAKVNGIFALYDVSEKNSEKDCDCRNYGIFSGTGERPGYVGLKLISKLEKIITFDMLKGDKIFSRTHLVRRNAQATYFHLTEVEFARLLKIQSLLEKDNSV